jgi:hypothetical protein
VQKIKSKYEAFMKAEYNVEAAVSHIGVQSEKMKQLDVINQYNFMLYLTHFVQHLEQIETVRNIGDVTQLSNLEMWHLSDGLDTLATTE